MEHDQLFKQLLTTFFAEFVELFLPDLAEYMERDRLEFLDKEVFTDLASAERHEVDLLVKVRFRDRGDAYFLIHVENQASAQDQFARRMFRYFARLHEKHALPVFPVAIFSYDQPSRPEPDRYQVEFPGYRVLDFAFRAIQLNRLNWRDYIRKPNPVASALMAKMKIAPEDRPRVKLECLRMLATLKLDKARSMLISVFMNAYLKMTTAEALVYNRELEVIEPKEREVIMQWTNEWIEQGKAEGLVEGREKGLSEGRQEGRQEGQQEGRRELVLRLLRSRVGTIDADLSEQVGNLSGEHLADFGEALLDFHDAADARRWLAEKH